MNIQRGQVLTNKGVSDDPEDDPVGLDCQAVNGVQFALQVLQEANCRRKHLQPKGMEWTNDFGTRLAYMTRKWTNIVMLYFLVMSCQDVDALQVIN